MHYLLFTQPDCGLCDVVKPEVYASCAATALLCVEVDATRPEHAALVAQYRVKRTPLLVLTDGTGARLASWFGGMVKAVSVIELTQRVQTKQGATGA